MKIFASPIPTQIGNVRLFAVTQNSVSAMPINAEAKDDPARLMRDCQAVASSYGIEVRFSCETQHGDSHFTFYPEST